MQKQSNLRDFDVMSKLGEGAFGQVFRVKRKADGKEYALKKVKIGAMKEKERQNALNQIRILASYNDQYIIGYKEAFYDDISGSLCVVMEFAQGGDILKRNQTHLKNRTKYKEQEIWKALAHMALGLKSLHDHKILHRDLKCANVFIANGIYKLGDLNVSKVLKKEMAQTQTGTPYYASPEVWKDKPYGAKSDIWSLGCVIYEMAALRPPFVATDLQGLYKKVCAGMFERIPAVYSNDLANIVSSLLKVDPQKRPSADQLLSSPIIRRHYQGKIQQSQGNEDDFDELLKTIKYNPRDLKALKNFLPKANYEEGEEEKQKLKIEDLKGGIQSCKNARKEPNIKQQIQQSLQNNDKKLVQFLERKRQIEEKERQNHLKMLMQQKEELSKKRQRVLSACGLRPPPNLYESPKIAVHKKNEVVVKVDPPSSTKNLRKDDQNKGVPAKLPPKPQQNLNYKLPPKPNSYQVENELNGKKPSYNSKEVEKISTPSRSNRSSSVQKIIYPSWWG